MTLLTDCDVCAIIFTGKS